jgi:DNA-directed RNA polymerase I, II, and III subunit RPABC2
MSDIEYSSESDSDNEYETRKPIKSKKSSIDIDTYNEENEIEDEIEDENEDEEDDDIKIGGEDSEPEEGEIKEDESDNESINNQNNDDESDAEENEEQPKIQKKIKKITTSVPNITINSDDEYEEDDDDDDDENYLQKFDSDITKNYIQEFHPECFVHNYEEITQLTKVVRNSDNIIIDPLHKTIPFLTKYEKSRVLGQRAKQIETGSKPFVHVPENVIDSYIIANLELQEKRIPFIIRRPLPNGGCEYWNLKDLENILF